MLFGYGSAIDNERFQRQAVGDKLTIERLDHLQFPRRRGGHGEGVGPVGHEEIIEARCIALLEAIA